MGSRGGFIVMAPEFDLAAGIHLFGLLLASFTVAYSLLRRMRESAAPEGEAALPT
jgi:hypothetical protein